MKTLFAILAVFVVTVIAIVALRPVAVAIDLVDRPGGRKTHVGEVPVIGGLAMFLGIVFGLGLLTGSDPTSGYLLSAFALVVSVGMLDDRYDVPPWVRLIIQAAAALLLTYGTDTQVTSLGDAFYFGSLDFTGAYARVITVLFVITAVNAFNMVDGMDGLAGSVAFVALLALGVATYVSGQVQLAAICGVLAAATAGYLVFNLPIGWNRSRRCFMGDAGSTLIGLALSWICIRSSQIASGGHIAPVTILWIVALPLFEFFWTVLRRLVRGQSPLAADAEHFHHLLLQAGFGVRGALLMFLALTVILAAVGMSLDAAHAPSYVSLAVLLVAGALIIRSMYLARGWLQVFPKTARRQRRLLLKSKRHRHFP